MKKLKAIWAILFAKKFLLKTKSEPDKEQWVHCGMFHNFTEKQDLVDFDIIKP